MNPLTQRFIPASKREGFGLVEVLVAAAITMISAIAALQVFLVSEGFRRATAGGGTLQTNGAIALYAIQRDLRQAGLITAMAEIAGCDLNLRGSVTLQTLAPVVINHAGIPAGDANTDTLLVTYGRNERLPDGDHIVMHAEQTNAYTMSVPASFITDDVVVPTPLNRAGACALQLATVTEVASATSPNVTTSRAEANAMAEGRMFNLGSNPVIVAYAVRNGRLTTCDYLQNDCGAATLVTNSTVWIPIANNIVSMRAQYGSDTSTIRDSIVDSYHQSAPATACDIVRVLAVRMVIVGRNDQFERDVITTTSPAWAGSAGAEIDLSDLDQWRHFRYQTYETTVPLRNVMLAGLRSGC